MEILTKRKFYDLFHRGVLGNHGPMWNTFEEYHNSNYTGEIAIRSRIPGGQCDYWLSYNQALLTYCRRIRYGESASNMQFSAMAPDNLIRLQGYVTRSIDYFDLFYNDIPGYAMRDGLEKHGKYCRGLEAKCRIQTACDPTSYDWIQTLFDNYPDAVIEFGVYNTNWGILPNLNTIIWEVRNY